MAKTIKNYGIAVCRSVEPATETKGFMWSWRQNYTGLQGELRLLESENKRPGEKFLYFSGAEWSEELQDHDNWYLRTGYGELSTDGKILTFRTTNSVYTFEITDKE